MSIEKVQCTVCVHTLVQLFIAGSVDFLQMRWIVGGGGVHSVFGWIRIKWWSHISAWSKPWFQVYFYSRELLYHPLFFIKYWEIIQYLNPISCFHFFKETTQIKTLGLNAERYFFGIFLRLLWGSRRGRRKHADTSVPVVGAVLRWPSRAGA